MLPVKKIISGGQTGVDRAALDGAIFLGIPYGGWLPPNRMTENGPLEKCYILEVMGHGGYKERTLQNVQVSDGTLILSSGPLTGGSALTQKAAQNYNKPCLHIDFRTIPLFEASHQISVWVKTNRVGVLNVAGPRASSDANIYSLTIQLLKEVFSQD